MKTVSSLLSPRLCSYPLSLIGHLEDILFVDIETTGFTARSSCLYLIGAIYFEKDQIHLMQFFAEKKEEDGLSVLRRQAEKMDITINEG